MRRDCLKCFRCYSFSLSTIDSLDDQSLLECAYCGNLYEFNKKNQKLYIKNLSATSDLYYTAERLRSSDPDEIDSIIHCFILRHKDHPMAIALLKRISKEIERESL